MDLGFVSPALSPSSPLPPLPPHAPQLRERRDPTPRSLMRRQDPSLLRGQRREDLRRSPPTLAAGYGGFALLVVVRGGGGGGGGGVFFLVFGFFLDELFVRDRSELQELGFRVPPLGEARSGR
uniref:Uncharacterized protein n=1 Tax=Ananas comosus var. bracteatus TaxID=296719 RepID=A0A6V7NJ91_ANACO|nr:unnamed protein product [Ananas comosus var. bracteatus]